MLADHIVVVSSALWVEDHKEEIIAALQAETGLTQFCWRPDDRMLAADRGDKPMAGEGVQSSGNIGEQQGVKRGQGGANVTVCENGVKFVTDPMGQKSGFYAGAWTASCYAWRMTSRRSSDEGPARTH